MNRRTRSCSSRRLCAEARAPAATRAAPLGMSTLARSVAQTLTLAMAAALAACSSTPTPEPQLYRLPLEINGSAAALPAMPNPAAAGHWQLVRPVRLPAQLEQDALLLPDAGTGVLRMSGHRWVEPLRDAIPRVLMHDLGRLLGGQQVLDSPLPPGLSVDRQLRLELLALEAAPGQHEVRLQARWSLADPAGQRPPRLGSARIVVPTTGTGPQAVVAAHRQALWQLAQQLVLSASASEAR